MAISLKSSGYQETWSLFSILVKALSEPAYSLLDYFKLTRGMSFLMKSKHLYNEILNINLEDRMDFQIPIFIFGGRKDPITPAYPVYQYFEKINSPHKEHIWFENSGHNCFFEEADKFFHCIKTLRTMLKLSRNGVLRTVESYVSLALIVSEETFMFCPIYAQT